MDGFNREARPSSSQPSYFHGGALRCARIGLAIVLTLIAAGPRVSAQGKRRAPATKPQNEKKETDEQLKRTREEFVRLTNEYKKTLEELIGFYEKDASRAEERLAQLKKLYADGLLSRRDLEAGERAVTEARVKISEARQQMTAADERVAETLLEEQAIEQMAKAPPLPAGKVVRTTTFIRYGGAGAWSLSGASVIQQFFMQRFGRPLPVSAFGQSALHDRWGLDHRNAMDVGLHPDSVEGQALMAFLRANGIPFSAFRGAIPGSATGPHIHVGTPSHRTRPFVP